MATTPEPIKGVPRIEGNPTPTVRADINALADWVRDNTDPSFANVAALPKSGNWVGRRAAVLDLGIDFVWQGTSKGWVPSTTVLSLTGTPAGVLTPGQSPVITKVHFVRGQTSRLGVLSVNWPTAFPTVCAFTNATTVSGSAQNPVVNAERVTRSSVEFIWSGLAEQNVAFMWFGMGW